MKIGDITLAEIRDGKNWRFVPPPDEHSFDAPMEDWGPLLDANEFGPDDQVIYSALIAYPSGRVRAIVLFKAVNDNDYGGDYCELIDGKWSQVGLFPNPNAEIGSEFIANPLPVDGSFADDGYRDHHRRGFRKYVGKL